MGCGNGCDEVNTPECTDNPCEGDALPLIPIGPCTCPCHTATPKPYYTNAEACEEAHKQVIIQNQYVTGLSTASPFIMPACQGTIPILIPGLQVIPIGSYLWNPTYGYLKVTAFDFASETVTVLNPCASGNVPPGTPVPSCTVFTVVDGTGATYNPCTATPTDSGALVVCKGSLPTVLAPTMAGQVPVSTGNANNVEFQTLVLEQRDCTTLSADFTYLVGNMGPYVLHLTDTSMFQVGELLVIGNTTKELLVTHVTSGVQLEGVLNFTPAATVTVPSGTAICSAPCCQQLNTVLQSDTQSSTLAIPVAVPQGGTAATLTTQSNIPNYGIGNINAYVTTKFFGNLWAKTSAADQMFTYEWYLRMATNLCAIGAHTPGALSTIDTITKRISLIESTGGVQELCDALRELKGQIISIPAGQELVVTTTVIFGVSYATDVVNDIMQVSDMGSSIVSIWLGR